MIKLGLAATCAALAVFPAWSAVIVSFETPGVVNTTKAGAFAVETFDSLPGGTTISETGNFVSTNLSQTISGVSFSYAGVAIKPADQYDGDSNSNYAGLYNGPYGGTNNSGAGYSLSVARTIGNAPINYFGLYISASDDSNTLVFSNNGVVIDTFTLGDFRSASGVPDQGSVFANFSFTGGQTYDTVTFLQPSGCCGFESDNHTVGTIAKPQSTGAAPETATWAMMLAGFGAMGTALRRNRAAKVRFA